MCSGVVPCLHVQCSCLHPEPSCRVHSTLSSLGLFFTGAIMEEQAAQLLDVKMCKFIPEHSRNLANEFRCYANYDSGLDYET